MKIYFTASLTGRKYYNKNYRIIVTSLKDLSTKVWAERALNVTGKEARRESREERIKQSNVVDKQISNADAIVAEVSYPSTSLGFEVALALKRNKPIIALYFDNGGDMPPILGGLKEEDLLFQPYNFENIKPVLKDCLDFLKDRSIEKRFTMLMAPKLLNELDKISKTRKIPRSVYIRELIEEDLKKKLRK